MPPPSASPTIRMSSDGVTYGMPGVKVVVAASGTVYAKLDSTANVNQVAWDVQATDGSALPASIALTQTGVVGERVSFAALGLGTAGILRATVNAGVGAYGNVDLTTTQGRAVWRVLAANGLAVGCVGESFEDDAVNGTAPLVNAAIVGAAGGGAGVPSARTIATTAPLTGGGDLSANRTLAISAATTGAAGSMSAADKAKLDALSAAAGVIITAPAVISTTNATPTALFTISPVPTGKNVIVEFTIAATITGGTGVGGHTGQSIALRNVYIAVNPSGTPSTGSGMAGIQPTNGVLWVYDEAAGFLVPILSDAFAANSVTVQVAGLANVNVDWSVYFHSALIVGR